MSRPCILSIALAMLLASGCTAARFATLENDLDGLLTAKERCRAGAPDALRRSSAMPRAWDADGATLDSCEFGPALLSLAADAEQAAGKARDERTKVGLLRLASVAAWQAGEGGFAETVRLSLKGQEVCAGLLERRKTEFGAPRDCAVLMGVGVLAQADQAKPKLEALANAPDGRLAAAIELERTLSRNFAGFARVRDQISDLEGIDAGVVQYFDRQHYIAHCNYKLLAVRAIALPVGQGEQAAYDGLEQRLSEHYCEEKGRLGDDWASKTCGLTQLDAVIRCDDGG